MSHIPRMTMIGMYNYDPTIFDGLTLPDGADKSIFVNSFLLEYGECRTLYPDVDFTKLAIANFSRKWSDNINRIFMALTEDYNPLHNFDRYENIKEENGETLKMTGTIATTQDGTIERSPDTVTENQVSAYNESLYQPESKTMQTGTVTDTYDKTDTDTHNRTDQKDENRQHTGHLYGNIGVTTSQQMLEAELSLRSDSNFYHIVAEMLYKEICLYYF